MPTLQRSIKKYNKNWWGGKNYIKPQLLRSITIRSDWGEGSSSAKEELKEDDAISMTSEMSRMSFEAAKPSVDRIISLDRKVIGRKQELLVNQFMRMN